MPKEIQLLPHQKEFIKSTSKKTLLLGGIGVGKTQAGSLYALDMISRYPKSKGLITANVYNQLINATVSTFLELLDTLGIPFKKVMGGAGRHIQVFDTKIYLYSLERPQNIRGIEVGWLWVDESAFSSYEAIQICRGRLRDKNGPLFERHTSSPNGYNWLYDEFEGKDQENLNKENHLVRAKTKENIFLPPDYYKTLLSDYGGLTNPLARQELLGEFVNLKAGSIYWSFDRSTHVKDCRSKMSRSFPVYVGQDFNIDNMEAIYVQYIKGIFYCYKENILNQYDANTDAAATQICEDLVPRYNPIVIPDSTGKNRKTSSSGKTDIEILKRYGLTVHETSNPFIRDRQNTLNLILKQNRIVIDPSCKVLIKELETLSSRDKEGDKAHVSVALGYVVWKLEPLRSKRKEQRTIQL